MLKLINLILFLGIVLLSFSSQAMWNEQADEGLQPLIHHSSLAKKEVVEYLTNEELSRDRENNDLFLSPTRTPRREDPTQPNIVSVTRSIRANYSAKIARDTLWNIQNLERYEPKVISSHVQEETNRTGTYTAWGFFAILPWRGTFSYQLTDTGFTSELLNSPIPSIHVKGGFLIKDEGNDQCQIIHYEKYKLPKWLSCMAPLIKTYVNWSMGRELNNIISIISQTALASSSHED